MYTLRLVVHPILGDLHLSGAIAAETAAGEWETVATFSEVLPVSPELENEDPVAIMIGAIREWSIRTIQ
jgi:hypothetical protein